MIEEYNTQVNIFNLVTLITREGRVTCKIKDRLMHIWAFSILCQTLTCDVKALAHLSGRHGPATEPKHSTEE